MKKNKGSHQASTLKSKIELVSKKNENCELKKNIIVEFINNEVVYYINHVKHYVKLLKATYLKRISKYTHLIMLNKVVRLVHNNQIRRSKLADIQ